MMYSPSGSVLVKNPPEMQETQVDAGLIIGPGKSPGEGNGDPLQYYCWGNSMDRGAWWATVHGVTKSQTRLSDLTSLHLFNLYAEYNIWAG